jgi:hypothetical protein
MLGNYEGRGAENILTNRAVRKPREEILCHKIRNIKKQKRF